MAASLQTRANNGGEIGAGDVAEVARLLGSYRAALAERGLVAA